MRPTLLFPPVLLLALLSGLPFLWRASVPPAPAPLSVALAGPLTRSVGPGDTMGCESLALSPDDVRTYFATADEVSPGEFHAEAVELPCGFGGRLTLDGREYDWRIQAAGAGYLDAADGQAQRRFICRRACERALPRLMGF